MKVFISWSGDKSRRIANEIHKWLPSVIQALRPYYSPDDISKGSRWAGEIAGELQASKIGLLILTSENLEAPWLLFEAGALSKSLEIARVCPLLFGVEPADVKGPLVQFQGAKFDKLEMKRVVKMMNDQLGDGALASDVLENVFSKWWPELEPKITSILSEQAEKGDVQRPEREILEEILSLTRSSAQTRSSIATRNLNPIAVEDLTKSFDTVAAIADEIGSAALVEAIAQLQRPVSYIKRQGVRRPGTTYRDGERVIIRSRDGEFVERDPSELAP